MGRIAAQKAVANRVLIAQVILIHQPTGENMPGAIQTTSTMHDNYRVKAAPYPTLVRRSNQFSQLFFDLFDGGDAIDLLL
jgi:hypothetical protein